MGSNPRFAESTVTVVYYSRGRVGVPDADGSPDPKNGRGAGGSTEANNSRVRVGLPR